MNITNELLTAVKSQEIPITEATEIPFNLNLTTDITYNLCFLVHETQELITIVETTPEYTQKN